MPRSGGGEITQSRDLACVSEFLPENAESTRESRRAGVDTFVL
jgi:hypothetical protein